MTPSVDVLDDIIGSLDPEDIPSEFILMAKIVDLNGKEMILRGIDLDNFMKNPFSVAEIRVILDIRGIRQAMMEIVDSLFSEVERIVNKT